MVITNEKERLKALFSYNIMDTDAEKHYDSITKLATYICKTSMAAINLIGDNRLWIKSKVGIDVCEVAQEISFCKYTIQSEAILEIKDTTLDSRFKNNPFVTGDAGIRYYAGIPLIDPDGYILGALCVFDTVTRELDEKQKEALKFLANEVVLHFEAAKKNHELQLLLKEQQKFQALFNNSIELHFVLNQNGKIEFVNESVEKQLGYTKEEITGRNIWDFCNPEDRANVLQKLKQTLNRGEKQIIVDTRMIAKNGESKWFSWSNVTANGKWLINGRDVTSQMAIQQELQQLSLVASHVNNGVAINDADNNILWVNKAFEKITGYELKDIKGRKLRNIIIGKDSDKQILEYAIAQTASKNSFSIEILAYHQEQKPIWLSIMNSVILDEQGEMNRSVEIITDITEQKKTELELQTLSFAVKKSEAGVLIRNGKEQVIWMNEALEKIWGWKLSELQGLTIEHQFTGKETNIAEYQKARKAVLHKKPYDIEIALYRKDGTLVWLSIYNNPLFDHEGNVIRQLSIITDITIRKKAEQELVRTREEALQLSRAKQTFLSVMSHEIRTPINAIIGMSRFLLDEHPAPHQLDNLNTLQFSSENLLKLVNDILDFTKIETGNMALEAIPVNLEELARRTLHTLTFKLDGKKINLNLATDAKIPEFVLADSTRLYQIMINLLGNAVKFTSEGEVKLVLTLEKEDQETVTIKFCISDTGIGIPPDKLDSIFEAYTQASTDTARKYGGTGLGLTITKKLIELHQSTIQVTSTFGFGSKFSFTINFNRTTDNMQAIIPNQEQENGPSLVLVADDDMINRTLAKKVLSKLNIQADIAENGLVALEMAMQKDYDLILMDMQMPVMDGLEATKKIRELPEEKYQTLPIIALTGSVFGIDLEVMYKDGLTDHFLKPYTPEGLYNKIKPYLKKQLVTSD
ncbi:PAS domain-containing hybrid sensor histidine kinase/response regulator [Mucilaginibacter arboris]|uniref:histidine kinase n=1 Tax=Mucilaginibacter arboris TaxID=2682090 RepID=A0A7K1SXP2_9SPHI|nr:PAS domain S-box protein [Mucilaginibacter arboris]MVN22092.1 PAS domain S-box protein [Mucilaginibacter arboris]